MFKRQTRLGLIHIPKTAGSAINNNLGRLLSPDQIHIRAMYKAGASQVDSNNGKRRLKVEFGSELHSKIKEMYWVSGHISALAMEEFNREFTFSVFRDRKLRTLSQYRYGRWRWDEAIKRNVKIQGAIPPNNSFSDWLARLTSDSRDKTRYGHNLITGEKFKGEVSNNISDSQNVIRLDQQTLLERLEKVDRIYFPLELQEVIDNLSDEGLAPALKIEENSRITEKTIYLKSKPEDVISLLNSNSNAINLESKIFEAARSKHSHYWTNQEGDDSTFLSICEKLLIV